MSQTVLVNLELRRLRRWGYWNGSLCCTITLRIKQVLSIAGPNDLRKGQDIGIVNVIPTFNNLGALDDVLLDIFSGAD